MAQKMVVVLVDKKNTVTKRRGRITKVGSILKPLNKRFGEVVDGWGTAGYMVGVMILFLLFLVIILELYNSSIILDTVPLTW